MRKIERIVREYELQGTTIKSGRTTVWPTRKGVTPDKASVDAVLLALQGNPSKMAVNVRRDDELIFSALGGKVKVPLSQEKLDKQAIQAVEPIPVEQVSQGIAMDDLLFSVGMLSVAEEHLDEMKTTLIHLGEDPQRSAKYQQMETQVAEARSQYEADLQRWQDAQPDPIDPVLETSEVVEDATIVSQNLELFQNAKALGQPLNDIEVADLATEFGQKLETTSQKADRNKLFDIEGQIAELDRRAAVSGLTGIADPEQNQGYKMLQDEAARLREKLSIVEPQSVETEIANLNAEFLNEAAALRKGLEIPALQANQIDTPVADANTMAQAVPVTMEKPVSQTERNEKAVLDAILPAVAEAQRSDNEAEMKEFEEYFDAQLAEHEAEMEEYHAHLAGEIDFYGPYSRPSPDDSFASLGDYEDAVERQMDREIVLLELNDLPQTSIQEQSTRDKNEAFIMDGVRNAALEHDSPFGRLAENAANTIAANEIIGHSPSPVNVIEPSPETLKQLDAYVSQGTNGQAQGTSSLAENLRYLSDRSSEYQRLLEQHPDYESTVENPDQMVAEVAQAKGIQPEEYTQILAQGSPSVELSSGPATQKMTDSLKYLAKMSDEYSRAAIDKNFGPTDEAILRYPQATQTLDPATNLKSTIAQGAGTVQDKAIAAVETLKLAQENLTVFAKDVKHLGLKAWAKQQIPILKQKAIEIASEQGTKLKNHVIEQAPVVRDVVFHGTKIAADRTKDFTVAAAPVVRDMAVTAAVGAVKFGKGVINDLNAEPIHANSIKSAANFVIEKRGVNGQYSGETFDFDNSRGDLEIRLKKDGSPVFENGKLNPKLDGSFVYQLHQFVENFQKSQQSTQPKPSPVAVASNQGPFI
ncbi:MAG: hypothetical protein HC852_11050 [Acaryochloridaceae cyanobacterium RU_4_10]|nr:hypothetical protein [Acaryochloridaceae cyanobacterium RU_4_10]